MAEKTEKEEEKAGLPVKQEIFLEAGVHIGTKIRTSDMREFIFKRRDDGLFILDLRKSAERLMSAAKLISRYQPEEIAVVASRIYSGNPAVKFAKLTGASVIRGRFTPGTMTNMTFKGFSEPKLLLVCDPKGEKEALLESAKNGVTVIGFCDSDNDTKFIDLVVPINNKGKRSLALAFYILARELMMAQGKISTYDEFNYEIRYFEEMVVEEEKEEEAAEPQPEVKEEKAEEAKAEEKPKEEKPEKEAKAEEKPKKSKKKEAKAEKPEEKPEAPKAEAKEEKAEKKEEPKKAEKKSKEAKAEEKTKEEEKKPKKE